MNTLKPQRNGQYSMIGTLAVMGELLHLVQRGGDWAGCAAQPSPLLSVPHVTAHPSTASVPTS